MNLQTTPIKDSKDLHIQSLPTTIPLLNYYSECPRKFTIAIIKIFIPRAFYISSSKAIFYKELSNIKQTFVNNNFPNKLVDQQIKLYLHNIHKNDNTIKNNNTNKITEIK